MIYYLIGQPGAGKTTIANELMLEFENNTPFRIDGDDIREIFDNKDYSRLGREKNLKLAHQIAQYLHNKGENVIMSLVSPYNSLRSELKNKVGDNLTLIYVHTSEVRGREQFFVEDYEIPTENYIDICTDNITVGECVNKILKINK